MDIAINRWIINTFGSSTVFAQISRVISELGSKWVIIAFLIFLMCFKRTRKMAIVSAIAVLITFLFNDYVLKLIINRDRPFQEDLRLAGIMNLINYRHPSGSSMPSGHAAVAMCLAISFIIHSKKFGIPAIIWAVFVGLSRVCLCVHYLSDVLVGYAVGAAVAVAIYFIAKAVISKYLESNKYQKRRK